MTNTPSARIDFASDEAQADLLQRIAAGHPDVLADLYKHYRQDVARLVYRMVGGRGDIEDVIQEVFFQVFRSLKSFRGQSKFSTWLHRLTVNVVLMTRRAARCRPSYADELPGDTIPDTTSMLPDEDVERRKRIAAFARLLDRLADKKRVVFVLHELHGVAPVDIAKIVGCPVLTVRTRLHYARRELEAMFAREPQLRPGSGQRLHAQSARVPASG